MSIEKRSGTLAKYDPPAGTALEAKATIHFKLEESDKDSWARTRFESVDVVVPTDVLSTDSARELMIENRFRTWVLEDGRVISVQ